MSTTTTTTAVEDEYTLLLRSKLGDEPAMDRMSTSFESVFQRVDVKSQTFRDIHQLSQAVNDIDMDFQKIRSDLWRFDQQGFRDQNGQVLQLTPRWIGYHDRFKQIMEHSYRSAVDASAFMDQYCSLLPDSGENIRVDDIPDMQLELEIFMKELEGKTEAAQMTQNSFKTLAEDVRLFAGVLKDALVRAGARLIFELNECQARLADLQRRLDVVNAKAQAMGLACAKVATAGADRGFSAAITVCPILGFLVIGAFFGSIIVGVCKADAYAKEAASLEKQINYCKRDLRELQGKEQLLKEYQDLFKTTQDDIAVLANKIDAISNIWQCLKADMQKLHEELRLALKARALPSRFLVKLRTARKVYSRLAELFEEYAKGRA
ncbi:uncharacterized protein TRAVEDRAFT_47405 [Trametes versicolor FP-101664 SS1]|uniref:uncharacterized protein n=1 Tax=Trametes versicolor (strain FP-101664) TaxID=717944 RepID=UPI0004624143|nr:uncharacterized protein TRAVEDRAFT_47405 [Trametes versicolor FP-101664 SS1]EIW58239.1 hypothetical protein TRAVEDRAFT_47405 [Trametes versicolor FP-101664 SS1]